MNPDEDSQESFGTSLRSKWSGLDEIDIVGVTSFTTHRLDLQLRW